MNHFLSGQGLVKIWEKEIPSLEIEQTATFQRTRSQLDLDGDGKPELVAFKKNEDKVIIRKSSGETSNLSLNYTTIQGFDAYDFGGFYRFFDTANGLKQMLMVKSDGQNIIAILIGIVGETEVDFNTPIPQEINNPDSKILNVKNYNGLNFEEIKVTFQDVSGSTETISIWEWQ
jgi:hypothetical protein